MMKTFRTLALLLGALSVSGCYITGMKLENQTGSTIHVYSHHTKTTTVIPSDRMKEFPHSSGLVTISVTNGPVWHYPTFSWFSDRAEREVYVKRHPILYKGTRGFLVETNGEVFALQPAFLGWKRKNFRNTQPDGFPLKPQTDKDLPNKMPRHVP